MYSKAVFDYFNTNQATFKYKPNRISRTNAFKRKSPNKKTVVMPNTSGKIPAQNIENRSAVSLVYDTVQSIWKYAKSFVSNPNLDPNRSYERMRKRSKSKYNTSTTHSHQDNSSNTLVIEMLDETTQMSNTNFQATEHLPEEPQPNIIEEYYAAPDIENVDFPIFFNDVKIQSTEVNFDNDIPKNSIPLANKQLASTIKEKTESKATFKNIEQNTKITEIFIKPTLKNNENISANALEVTLKSSLKTYGRGKRKNKKLHVHFKDDHDNERPKYSSYKTQNLRKSDCCHPNAFYKKLRRSDRNKSNIAVKNRRLTVCATKNSLTSFRKKKSKRTNSTSNVSLQTKSSDTQDSKIYKKNRKIPKKYSTYSTTKIYKKKPAKKNKKVTKGTKAFKNIANNKPKRNIKKETRSTSFIDELYQSQISNLHLQQEISTTDDDDDLFGRKQTIFETIAPSNLLNDINDFAEYLMVGQLDESTFDNVSSYDENL